jgi:hypothetical protein
MVALATPRNANPSSVFLFQYFGSANQPPAGDHTLVVSKPPADPPMFADEMKPPLALRALESAIAVGTRAGSDDARR